jgi:hypothetical protein
VKTALTTFAKCFATGCLLMGTLPVLAQPTFIVPATGSIAPNGIGVTSSELLFSQPYCDGVQPRGVYSATSFVSGGTGILDATMTEVFGLPVQSGCSAIQGAENYFAISPGLGGFTLGSVYATTPNGLGGDAVYKDGVSFIPSITDPAPGHAGITFDTVGTFNNYLFVTTPAGVFGYDSGGNLQLSFPAPVAQSAFESATVAPALNTACAGCLYITSDTIGGGQGSVYTVPAHSPTGTNPTFLTLVPGTEPEGIQFVTPNACTLGTTGLSYFVSGYAHGGQITNGMATNGALLAYSLAQVTPFVGDALIPIEIGGSIYAMNPATKAFTTFSTPTAPGTSDLYQFEGNTLAECAPAAGGCPATQGYWKHHAMATPTLTIGGVTYTDAQLVTILDTAPKGGDATLILVHQLIAALANEAAGAKHTGIVEDGVSVDTAIADANSLLATGLPQAGFPGSNPSGVSFPINLHNSTGTFVQAGTTLGGYFTTLSNVLNDYNSAVGLNCSEGSGLVGAP